MGMVIRVVKKPDVTDLNGEKVMIDFDTDKYYMLKGVANDIWDFLEDGMEMEEVCNRLLAEYDVTKEVCEQEVKGFLEKMEQIGFLKLEN